MHSRLRFLYDCDCDGCKSLPDQINLAEKGEVKRFLTAVEKAFKKLHSVGKYDAKDLGKIKEYGALVKETANIFNEALTDNDIPEEMLKSLKTDIFIFSGLKTHSELLEASRLLLTEDEKLKSFSQFSKDTEKLKSDYNDNYLEAEYQFAVTSSQMAGKWANISSDYDLQYRTAGDDRVRVSHKALHDITLPADDAFWISYYPPNGWRCRCTALEVRKGKYAKSDTKKAIAEGEKATSQIDKDGKNKLEIFRFNPGQKKVVFPPAHPYHKTEGAKAAKKEIQKLQNGQL